MMARWHLVSSLAVALACTVAACFDPGLRDCVISCGSRSECPSNQTCHGGLCSSGVECTPDGPTDVGEAGDLASEEATSPADLDADASMLPDASSDDSDASDDGHASDASDASVDDAQPACPPGIRISARTGRCAPMNDLNGDGLADGIAGFDDNFDALISDGTQFQRVDGWIHGGPWSSSVSSVPGVLTGDVNGDRITDIVTFAPTSVTVLTLPGTGTGGVPDFLAKWSDVGLHGSLFTYLADVSGDGKDDVIAINDGETDVALSRGFDFAPPTVWASENLSGYNGAYFADVDGDYRADAITVTSTANVGFWFVKVSISGMPTKPGFLPSNLWLGVDLLEGDLIHFADADGDGRADFIRVRADATTVALSDGGKFGPLETWIRGSLAGFSKTSFVDVDGDGRADIVAVDQSAVQVALSTGTAFAPPTVWYTGTLAGANWINFAFEPAGGAPGR
jgi:hypothetical protein